MDKLKRQLPVKIRGNTYQIEVPTVGQFMEMESRKMALSNGSYNDMIRSMTKTALVALDIIDTVSLFMALMPKQFWDDLKVDSLLELDMVDMMPLVKVYIDNIQEWYQGWLGLFERSIEGNEKKSAE